MAAIAPAEVFPPGDFLREELEARGWSQVEFAEILGRPLKLVNEIIVGKKRITPETAKELGAALGTSAELWLNLEVAYRLRHSEPPAMDVGADRTIPRAIIAHSLDYVRDWFAKEGWSQELT